MFWRPITKGSGAGLLPLTAFIASEKGIEKDMIEQVEKIIKISQLDKVLNISKDIEEGERILA